MSGPFVTALLAFLRLAWPYLLAATVGGIGAHELDQIPYDRQVTAFASYKAQVAEANEKAQKAATAALQAQINTRLTIEANNEKVVSQLMAERDSTAVDLDLSRRLLSAAAARPASPSHSMPQAAGGQPAPAASPASGGGSLTQELAAAIDECRSNADQLDALIAEIKPQLGIQ